MSRLVRRILGTLTTTIRIMVLVDLLVGFSMGGGEVARYIDNYRSQRVSKARLRVSSRRSVRTVTRSSPER